MRRQTRIETIGRSLLAAACAWMVATAAIAQQNEESNEGSSEKDEQKDQRQKSDEDSASDQQAEQDRQRQRRRQPRPSGDYPEVNGLQIHAITLAKKYEKGKPVNETTTFSRGRVFAIIDIANNTPEATKIRVSWTRSDKKGWKGMPLDVPAKRVRHRTAAFTWATPREPGDYKVVVRTQEGEKLGEKSFTISR